MAELVGGALLGAAVSELLKAVIDARKKSASFKEDLRSLEITITSISDHIADVTHLENKLKESRRTTKDLIDFVHGGEELVLKCTKVGSSNFVMKVWYSKRLLAFDNRLMRYFSTVFQLDLSKDIKMIRVVQLEHTNKFEKLVTGEPSSSQDQLLVRSTETTNSSSISPPMAANIILNPDFALQYSNWTFSSGKGSIVGGTTSTSRGEVYARVTNRREDWQGLEQVITSRFKWGTRYHLTAYVKASKSEQKITATLRLEYRNKEPEYEEFGWIPSTFGQDWEELSGEILLDPEPQPVKVVFYIEGPDAGVDLLVKFVSLTSSPSST